MVNMLATVFVLAHSLSLYREDPAEEPIDTQTVVATEDYSKYDTCDTPGECSAPCSDPQIFHLRMCESWMCNYCTSEFCAESCKEVQAEFPTCRCADWPGHKNSYEHSDIPPVDMDSLKK
jgi:hypothetical protein